MADGVIGKASIDGSTDDFARRILRSGSITDVQPITWPGSSAGFSSTNYTLYVRPLTLAILWGAPFSALSGLDPFSAIYQYLVWAVLGPKLAHLFDTNLAHIHGTNNWNDVLLGCSARGVKMNTTNKIVISLGGNDVLRAYEDIENFEAVYYLQMALTDPLRFIKEVFSGRRGSEFFWYWHMNVKKDETVEAVKSISHYFLASDPNNEIILLTVAPGLTSKPWPGGLLVDSLSGPEWLHKLMRLYLFTSALKDAYNGPLKAHFTQQGMGNRFHILDVHDAFALNVFGDRRFYFDLALNCPGDGVHFCPLGNSFLGRMLALKMVQIGWFLPNPALQNAAFPANPLQAAYSAAIDQKAMQINVPETETMLAPLKEIPGGYKKEYSTHHIYLKAGEVQARALHGAVLARYIELGESSGILGFPTTDQFCECALCTCNKAEFECGWIFHNSLDFITPVRHGTHCDASQ